MIGAANRQPCAAAASLARHAAGRVLTLQVSHMEAQAAVAAGAVILDVRRAASAFRLPVPCHVRPFDPGNPGFLVRARQV